MGNKHWDELEKQIIKRHFNPKKSTESAKYIISNFLFDRTIQGVQYCASRMGLTRQIRRRKWLPIEIKRLSQLAEKKPLPEIYTQMRYFWNKNGLHPRTEMAVRQELSRLGFDLYHDSLTIPGICEGLRCNDSVVHRWLKTEPFSKVLQPIRMHETERSPYYVKTSNFRRFAKKYPAEIARCVPDILWLVTILTSDYD